MADALAYIQWDSYKSGIRSNGFFADEPLTFSSRQERLQRVAIGEPLWLVSRCPDDGQHYFVCVLSVKELRRNPADSEISKSFGDFAVVAAREQSCDLGAKFAADGLLRALEFETGKSIKFGA